MDNIKVHKNDFNLVLGYLQEKNRDENTRA